MESQPSIIRFSLEEVPERERIAIMREQFGRGVVNMDFVPLSDTPRMELEIRLLPGVAITRGEHSAFRGDSGYDPSRNVDDFCLNWVTRCSDLVMIQRGREIGAEEGTAVLFSGADRLRGEHRGDLHFTSIRLTRSLLGAVLPRPEDRVMQPIPAQTEALRLLGAYLGILRKDGEPRSAEVSQAASLHIADLVALALGTNRDAAEHATNRGLRAARAASVKAWTIERIADPSLSVAAAAAAHRVSPRYVQRLFEAEGTSFSKWLRGQRLALARRRLADPALAHVLIGTIAFDCGFSDLSWFNHAFRQAYGETPSDIRQGARSQTRH